MDDKMKSSVAVLSCIALCICYPGAWSFETGAPPSTCLTMFPKHNNTERWEAPCPFNITLSSTTYTPSQLITVRIEGPSGRTFRGVQIRAHRVKGDRETILGSFESFPNDLLKPFSCFGGKNNMLTHKSPADKARLTLVWRAPQEPVGDVVFTATIVETFQVFWIDQSSSVLVDPTSSSNLGELEEVSNSDPDIALDGCGESKGCLLYPRLCRGSGCDAAVSFRLQGDWVHFEMLGKAEGYISLGFSDDIKMQHDETLSCTADGSRVTVQRGYNPARFNERQYTVGIVNMTTIQKDGVIYCRFSRPRMMSVTSVVYNKDNTPNVSIHEFDLGLDWYLMLAWGYTYQDTDVMGHHKELPIVTHKKFSLSSTDIHYGTTFSIWLQLHSTLAVFCWMFLVGCAAVISRHYREGFGAKMTCGSKLWLQLHRYLVAAGFCSMAVSFIVIFVHLQDWSKYAGPHMYLGVAVMVAMVIQIFAGLLRPSPASKFRIAFNWIHKIFGKLTHIAAGVEISLAFGIPLLPHGMRYYGTIIVFVYIGVQIAWDITLDIVAKCKARKSKSEFNVSNQFKLEEKYPEKTSRASHILLAGYVISMLILTICTIGVIKFY